MKRYRIQVGGRTFDVCLLSDPREEVVQVEVDGQVLTVGLEELEAAEDARTEADSRPDPVTRPPPADAKVPQGPSGKVVTAPLPGVIKNVVVRPGEQVAAGATLLVIEAMKMDNVIRASRTGIIETIHVAEGHRVAHGELMLEYRS